MLSDVVDNDVVNELYIMNWLKKLTLILLDLLKRTGYDNKISEIENKKTKYLILLDWLLLLKIIILVMICQKTDYDAKISYIVKSDLILLVIINLRIKNLMQR